MLWRNCAIGGWVLKYLGTYLTGNVTAPMDSSYFGNFIGSVWPPIIWFAIYLGATMFIVYKGVDKGIEKFSRVLLLMLLLQALGILKI